MTEIATGATARTAIAHRANATILGRAMTIVLAVRIRRDRARLRPRPSSNVPRVRDRRARMSTSAMMPMTTTCPPRSRLNAELPRLATSHHVRKSPGHATKVSHAPNAKANALRNAIQNDRPIGPRNANRPPRATSNRVAVSATRPIAIAMQIARGHRAESQPVPTSPALSEVNGLGLNNHGLNVRGAIARAATDQNRSLVPTRGQPMLVRPKRAHRALRNRALPSRDPLNPALSSAMLHLRANAPPSRRRLNRLLPNPRQPRPSPNVSPRRRPIRRSLRSPAWV